MFRAVNGTRYRKSTHEENLDQAKDGAEEWYLNLRGKLRRGEIIKKETKFKDAAEHYLREIRVLAASSRRAFPAIERHDGEKN